MSDGIARTLCLLLLALPAWTTLACSGESDVARGPAGGGSGADGGAGNGGIGTGGGAAGNAGAGAAGTSEGCERLLNQAELDTGFETCDDGSQRRRAALECPTEVTVPTSPCRSDFGPPLCTSDADCTAEPLGYCANAHNLRGYCGCYYGCRRDSDCGSDAICECGVVVGRCVPATCTTNADCDTGFGCVATLNGSVSPTCIWVNATVPSSYACQTDADECRGDSDCPGSGNDEGACLLDGDARACGTLCAATP